MTAPTVAACQLAIEDLDVEANRDRVRTALADLPAEVDLAVFPEQTLTGFVADDRIEAAAIRADGPEIDGVAELASDADLGVVVGFVEDAEKYYNATAYVDPDGSVSVYRKRHLWAGERRVLEPGDERLTVETPAGTAALLTCYDLNFVAESAATARPEVDLLVVVGAWPAAHRDNWRLLVRARALDGVRWTVASGRVGRREVEGAPDVTYAGHSLVVYPGGTVHGSLDLETDSLVATLDPATRETARERIGVFTD
jgi:(R)-amidase